DAGDLVRVPLADPQFQAGVRVPNPYRLVFTAADNELAVGAPRDASDRFGVPPEGLEPPALGGVPDVDRPVVAAGRNALAIGAEGHVVDPGGVPAQRSGGLAGLRIPDVYPVELAAHDALAVRAPRDAGDRARGDRHGHREFARHRVPHFQGCASADGDPLTVGTKGHARGGGLVAAIQAQGSFAGARVPDDYRAVVTAAGDAFAVGANGHAVGASGHAHDPHLLPQAP